MNRLHTRRIRVSRAARTPVCVVALAAAFLLALSGVAFADVWTDISDATWQNVYHVSAADASTVAEGFPDGTFRPYQQVTRGQFAKMVTDGLDIPLFDPAVPSFSDVPTNHIFYQHIEGAVAAGVISGYPDDTYRPDNNIMRQQANSILGLWLSDQEIEAIGGIQGADGFYDSLLAWFAAEGDEVLSGFDDRLQIAPVHRPGTAYLVMRGVVLGSSSGATTTLGPLGELSRAQAVTMIVRTRDVVFEADPPTVTNVDPEAGPATGGNSVVITGTGFGGLSGASAVTFGTHNATSYVVDSLTQITAVAPAGVAGTTVDVRVTNTGGTSAVGPADKYTYRTLHIAVTGIADPVTAGTVSTVTLSVVDQADDVVTDYTGTVHFTSNDTAAVLPANYTFKASDAGTHTFTGGVTLKTAGERTVTATDTVTSSITGTQTVTVNHAAAGKVSLETLANGTGTTIDATGVVGGGTVTAYSVTRDTYDNFVENAASAWSLTTKTGGVVNADLVAASDGKSAVFTGHLAGTCKIHAVTTVGAFADDTGVVTVSKGPAAKVSLETAANGTGTTIDATSVASGGSLTVFAVKRDAGGNYIANAASDSFVWTLSNLTPATGGVVVGDLVPATGGQSAVFTGHLVGTCKITVTPGAATKVAIETLANGSGSAIGATSVASGSSFTAYAVTRDAHDNYVGNPSATWSLTDTTGGVTGTDLAPTTGSSSVFTGHLVGTGTVHAVVGALTDDTGVVTVTAGPATKLAIETLANGTGTAIDAVSVASGGSFTAYAITRDADNNFVGNPSAAWSVVATSLGVTGSDLAPSTGPSSVFTGHLVGTGTVRAVVGALTDDTGVVTVTVGPVASVNLEDAANGTGTNYNGYSASLPLSTSTAPLYAVTRDAEGNFVANAVAVWTLRDKAGVLDADLVAALDNKSAVFNALHVGSCIIRATVGSLFAETGTISVVSSS
jgi:hypothetical protein